MRYILFQCMECKKMMAFPERTSDGHKCNDCRGMLKPINKGTKEELRSKYKNIAFPSDRKNNAVKVALMLAEGMMANGDNVAIEFNNHKAFVRKVNEI